MSDLDLRLDTLVAELEAGNPERVCTREAYMVNHASREDLRAGIFSVVSARGSEYRSTISDAVSDGYHRVLIIARVQLDREATGAEVEREELAMLQEVKTLLRRSDLPEILTGGELRDWQQSAQQEVPHGFVVMNLRFLGA